MKKSKTFLKPEAADLLICVTMSITGDHGKKEKVLVQQFLHPSFYSFRQKCLLCSRHRFRSCDLWVMGPARFLCASLLRAQAGHFCRYSSCDDILAYQVSQYSNGLVAQGLEHCSSKAGVESSNLSEAFFR